MPSGPVADLPQQVVDLPLDPPDLDGRIGETGRADDLLDHDAARFPKFERTRRRGYEDDLVGPRLPLVEIERPVVERRRQAEPVLDQDLLSRPVAVVHPPDLRHCLVALVDEDDRVGREVVEQRRRRLARCAAGEVPRVVLDPVAVANLADHLEVEHRALVQALGLEQLAPGLERRPSLRQFRLDRGDRPSGVLARRDEVRLGVDRQPVLAARGSPGQRIEDHQLVDLVPEEADPDGLLLVGRVDLHDVAADPERAAPELDVIALVLDVDELAEDLLPVDPLPHLERNRHPVVGLRRTQAVDARHAGDDDDVTALEQRPGGREPQAVDLVVDRRLFLDVGVARRDVGFRLVVVVVADEVLDGVAGEEAPELLVELRRQRLVVHHHQRGAVLPGDDLRHRERLARPGHPQQDLARIAAVEPLDQLVNRPRLVAAQLEVGDEFEPFHQMTSTVLMPCSRNGAERAALFEYNRWLAQMDRSLTANRATLAAR